MNLFLISFRLLLLVQNTIESKNIYFEFYFFHILFKVKDFTSIYDSLMNGVPDYSRFYTVDELYNHSRTIAMNHTVHVKYQNIGFSQNGEAIPMVTMGNGTKSLLLYACPHANEPIRSLLVDYLLNILNNYSELLFTYTWYLIPCIDPDGTRLNEYWFSGPFTIRNL